MDLIREHLIYKDIPLHVCMNQLKPTEHYEVVRFLLATRTKDVHICMHESTNDVVNKILHQLPIGVYDCRAECRNQAGIFLAPPSTAGAGDGAGAGSGVGSG
jgi:hypothetical protein